MELFLVQTHEVENKSIILYIVQRLKYFLLVASIGRSHMESKSS